jgi:hypothetical protein
MSRACGRVWHWGPALLRSHLASRSTGRGCRLPGSPHCGSCSAEGHPRGRFAAAKRSPCSDGRARKLGRRADERRAKVPRASVAPREPAPPHGGGLPLERHGPPWVLRARLAHRHSVLAPDRALLSSLGFNSWSVGENLLWGSDRNDAAFAVREWMESPPHRRNILSRDWREVGIGAVFFGRAPGVFGGRPVTIVTADFSGSRG